jgi:large subunit ribosomal protein L29
MKIKDLREMNPDELEDEASQMRKRLFEIRTQAVTEKLENPATITKTKRDIARVLTVIREREIRKAQQVETQKD